MNENIQVHVTTHLVGSELGHAAATDQSDDVRLTEHLGKAYASSEVWRDVSLRDFRLTVSQNFTYLE